MQKVALFPGIGEAELLLDGSGPLCGPESKKRGGREMRTARIVEEGGGYYHVMSRIVDRRMVIDDSEKGILRYLMRGMEGFSGVEIVTYAILDNHFHILLYVPERQDVEDDELIRRLGCLYSKPVVKSAEKHLVLLREKGLDAEAEEFKLTYSYRMYDLAQYMKTLKQRFSQGFNKRHGRKGTLWEERYKSLVVQPAELNATGSHDPLSAVAAVAAYIDLNPVRASIVEDPKDYHFSGYGEALGGGAKARKGIGTVARSLGGESEWPQASEQYRKLLYTTGEESGLDDKGRPLRKGFSAEEVQAVLDAGGKLSLGQVLRCRVRYFSDGLVLGSRAYVDEVFKRHRDHFGAKRKTGARPMSGAQWSGLCTARRLRLEVIATPQAG